MTTSNAQKKSFNPAGQGLGSADALERLQGDTAGFQRLASYLKTNCGIDLPHTPKNLSLMASRMRKVLLARGLSTYGEFADLLETGDAKVVNEFTSALTTNTTHFFREGEHFEHLRRSLPEIIAAKRAANGPRELRVWCAASSTGQEPYTILMTILESGALPSDWSLKFIATDIDLDVLARAAKGIYREDDLEKVPKPMIEKYFDKGIADGDKMYRIKPAFSSMIRFARLNLIDSAWPFQHKFDVVFCRNVLIYFDGPTAQRTVERLAEQTKPGGYLYVGHSECGHVKTRLVRGAGAAVYLRGGSQK